MGPKGYMRPYPIIVPSINNNRFTFYILVAAHFECIISCNKILALICCFIFA